MKREALTDKIFVLGVDGLDPSLARKYVNAGKMPNLAQYIERGAAREDLMLLGAVPTITPPLWTTLATGAYPMTHGITCFFRQSDTALDEIGYNLLSTYCKAEQLWNVFAEAGKKTLVWHWPGSAWPPSSDSPHLHVVDGSSPGSVNMSTGQLEGEFVLIASPNNVVLTFKEKAAADSNVPCVITDMDVEEPSADEEAVGLDKIKGDAMKMIFLDPSEGQAGVSETPIDFVLSPIKEASGWANAPEGAKEFGILFSRGLIRRVGLILPNAQDVYDHVAIYKNKKETVPMLTLQNDEYKRDFFDDSLKNDVLHRANRDLRVLEIAPDGSYLKMWFSAAMDTEMRSMWHPQTLFDTVVKNVGYPCPTSMVGGGDKTLISDCMLACWYHAADWQSEALNYLMTNEGYEVVFSHFHNVDLEDHMFIHYMKNGSQGLDQADYAKFMEDVYVQTDYYLGKFLPRLDEGWTVLIVSDHGQVCPEHHIHPLGDTGINIRIMQELGFTNVLHDADGNELHEIDWAHTKAVAARGNHIYINLKGRNATGIVEPEDQYELEEEIMTALYGYRDQETGKRIVALALRRKDAVLLGLGCDYPQGGDIIYFMAEGYNYDHGDSLSTVKGFAETSVSPIFIAAGRGIRHMTIDRYIRQVDIAPTVAVLGGVRFPAQCEGAPAYQIFTEDI